MKTSETFDQLFTALAAAEEEMPDAVFNKTNPHFGSSYADFAAIRAATRVLAKHGLAVTQGPQLTPEGWMYQSTLVHGKSQQWVEHQLPMVVGTPQQVGSLMTYWKRYLLSGQTAVAADADDDGEVAEMSAKSPASQTPGPKKTPHAARKNKDWEVLKTEMDATTSVTELQNWGLVNSERIHALPDSWQVHFREAYDAKRTELREGVTEEGSALKDALKKSIADEIDDEIPTESGSAV